MHFPRMSVFAAVCSTHYTHAPPGGRQASTAAATHAHTNLRKDNFSRRALGETEADTLDVDAEHDAGARLIVECDYCRSCKIVNLFSTLCFSLSSLSVSGCARPFRFIEESESDSESECNW